MQTPYILHTFGDGVSKKYQSHRGWITAGVASSIPWPSHDVCIVYAGDEYMLRGSENKEGQPSPPGITMRCGGGDDVDNALSKIYRLSSILGWFLDGYVDVGGHVSGSHPFLYGNPRNVYSSIGIAGTKSFSCNHMPIIDKDNVRIALAFWREGKRLSGIHESYSFLSFYKVIESQYTDQRKKRVWIEENLDNLTERAGKRIQALRDQGIDVSTHLFESCRCAVAHASLEGEIVDPDIPQDRKRIRDDLDIMQALARLYIEQELKVPTARTLYQSRDRLAPWDSMFPAEVLASLRRGEAPTDDMGLDGKVVAIGLWPDGPIAGLEDTTASVVEIGDGVVSIALVNKRETLVLFFHLDYRNGRLHTDLENGGVANAPTTSEEDVIAYATFFYRALCNAKVELTIEGFEPIDCEVVIPVNIMPPNPDEAVAAMVAQFRASGGYGGAGEQA